MAAHAMLWNGLWGLLVVLVLGVGESSAQWTAKEQPDLKDLIGKAPELKVEEVCTPVRSVRRGELMWAPNPDGKTYDLLQWYYKDYSGPTTVFIMDLSTGKITKDGIPDKRQIHICGKAIGPNGKLYIATPDWEKGMEIYVYDPAKNALSCMGMKAPRLKGENRVMTLSPDGKIFGTGSYDEEKKVGLYQIDPATDEVTDYGPVGPSHAPGGVWGQGIAADERYVYIVSGKIPYYLVCYDRETKKEGLLVTTEKVGGSLSVRQHLHGASASATKVVGTDGRQMEYWLWQGKAIPKKDAKEAPPWPEPRDSKPLVPTPPRPEIFDEAATPKSDGKAEIWYRPPEAKAAAPRDAAKDARPEDLGWKALRYTVPTYPLDIYRVVELADGRIFGTAGSYEGNFLYDPKSDKSVHMGKIPLSHYTTAILDGKVYMSGYWSGPLYIYDPARPWTVGNAKFGEKVIRTADKESNPWFPLCFRDVAGVSKMYASAVGADGKVYFGGRWYRDGNGGGLAWWDPTAGKAGGLWEIFSNYQIDYMTTAHDREYVVIGSFPVRDDTLGKPTPTQGKLFVFDTAQAKTVREIEPILSTKNPDMEKKVGVGWPGCIVGVGGSRVLGMTTDPEDGKATILYGVDVESGEVAFRKKIPFPFPVPMGSNQKERFDYRLGPDGEVWTFIGEALVRIDPTNASVEVIGKIKAGGRLAFSGNDIYISGSTELRRIRR